MQHMDKIFKRIKYYIWIEYLKELNATFGYNN